ncbi:hypothetical protein ERY13_07590 [Paenibacillus mucilaginosus]|uniref:hypothetical protein n=1 Tax=Paenibacillus mucilaginosus TaxID=61624 RepID=UPI0002FBE4FB|nr:hypothetical protein [Paenibacillus mucilaginosus]WFA17168.1 hypothetical protein ERY13_07590 [Paenibacillus mucilaginosus]
MPLRASKSDLLNRLETTLDENEEYIGSTVWKALEEAFERVDDEADEIERELEEAQQRIEELESALEALKYASS